MKNFWIKNAEFGLPANAIAMYFYLRYVGEKEKYDAFALSDKQLSQALGIHRNTVHKVRNALLDKQLISVSFKKGMPPVYSVKENKDMAVNEDVTVLKENRNIKKINEKEKQSGVVANIPSLSEFLDYAKGLEYYEDSLDGLLEKKYNQWKNNGWNNAQGRPITDYRASLKSALPFLKGEPLQNIKRAALFPTIKRP